MMKSLRRLLRNKKGATAVEYGIMVAAIAAVIIATVFVIGGEVDGAWRLGIGDGKLTECEKSRRQSNASAEKK